MTTREEQRQAVRAAQRTAPEPAQVLEGRARRDREQRLPDDRPARPWYCRSCGVEVTAATVPRGWYTVNRHTGTPGDTPARLGASCSAEYLDAQLLRLIGVEADAGDDWDATARYRQVPR